MNIYGLNKTTLLDYPGKLAATIFLGGCNFRCPFCHNSSLVFLPKTIEKISEENVFQFLHARRNILEGVCITGGEPTLTPNLEQFISKIKDLGYNVKLDTNGSNPYVLKDLVHKGLIDYVAMDIKNSKEKYKLTTGNALLDLTPICESVNFLLSGDVDYEFRTTVVKELHTPSDIQNIGKWIEGAKALYLQAYEDSKDVISPGYSSYSKTQMQEMVGLLHSYVQNTQLRGID